MDNHTKLIQHPRSTLNIEITDVIEDRVITVFIFNAYPRTKKTMRCMSCGLFIDHYYGEINMVMDIDVSVDDVSRHARIVEIKCKRCKVLYRLVF